MKFGKRLYGQLFQPWKQYYLNYELLKQHIKFALATNIDKDGKFFWLLLDNEFRKINFFYSMMEHTIAEEFNSQQGVINLKDLSQITKTEIESFSKFCKTLETLRYYVVLNYIAVIKVKNKKNSLSEKFLFQFSNTPGLNEI